MRRITAVTVLLLGLAVTVHAQEVLQTFNVSKKSPGTNLSPAIALNEKKGDVGAVWIHSDENNPGESEIWFSLLKRKPDGSFKVKKSKKISDSAVLNSTPTIVYNKERNEYLVGWISQNPANASPASEDKIDVSTCRISSTGKVLSLAVIYTVVAIAYYSNPVLYYMHEGLVGSDPAARFMLFFSCRGAVGGLFLLYLNALGQALGNPTMVMEGDIFNGQQWEIVCNSIIAGPGNVILLGLTLWAYQQNGQFNPRTLLISMTGLGVILHTLILQATYSMNVRLLLLSPTLILAAWWSYELQDFVMRRVLFPELIFTGALLATLKGPVQLWVMMFIAVAANTYYLFGSEYGNEDGFSPAAPNDWIYARKIRSKGKAGGKDMQVFSHQGRLRDLVGVGLPMGNEDAKRWPVLLVWQKMITRDTQEIRAVVIQP